MSILKEKVGFYESKKEQLNNNFERLKKFINDRKTISELEVFNNKLFKMKNSLYLKKEQLFYQRDL